jgi:TPR repeat protein
LYAHGWGVEQNHRKAAELYTKAANQGLPLAMLNLAGLYYRGLGIPPSNMNKT